MTDVRILWGQRKVNYPGEYAPELMIAWDEYCLDSNWDGWEEDKARAIREWGDDLVESREMVVTISDDAIDALFAVPVVTATVADNRE
jgi:hypothetical protein